MTTEKRTRRKYTEDFKQDAVALVIEQDYKISEASIKLSESLAIMAVDLVPGSVRSFWFSPLPYP